MGRSVRASVNYVGPMRERPRYHANDISRDVIALDPREVEIGDARAGRPSLEREGFTLVRHTSRVTDFRDAQAVQAVYAPEVEALVLGLCGADQVRVTSPGVLRFGEKSADSGRLNNSRPARFVHVDINDETAALFALRAKPAERGGLARFAHFNVWRALTAAPQDVPLALCEAASLEPRDLMEAEAVFDEAGKPEWSFTGLVVRANPRHRWRWFPDMGPGEAIVFKTHDSDPAQPHCVAHSAFDDPGCPPDTPPRASLEMRAIAFWYD
ncbi:MAG: CmcJ/NvfI family oxidoreductase [Phenylobacterium sp.]